MEDFDFESWAFGEPQIDEDLDAESWAFGEPQGELDEPAAAVAATPQTGLSFIGGLGGGF